MHIPGWHSCPPHSLAHLDTCSAPLTHPGRTAHALSTPHSLTRAAPLAHAHCTNFSPPLNYSSRHSASPHSLTVSFPQFGNESDRYQIFSHPHACRNASQRGQHLLQWRGWATGRDGRMSRPLRTPVFSTKGIREESLRIRRSNLDVLGALIR